MGSLLSSTVGWRLVPSQCVLQLCDLACHRSPVGAGHEDCVVLPREPAHERPARYAVMRDEGRPGRAAQDQYVEPAYVIGDEEDVAGEGPALDPYARAHSPSGETEETRWPGRIPAQRLPEEVRNKA